jgi:AhpC/TSA antioxidant enzyme
MFPPQLSDTFAMRVLCSREHALDLTVKAPEIEALGVKLVGVVHEELGSSVFAKDFFPAGELYFDKKKAFFESLGSRYAAVHI